MVAGRRTLARLGAALIIQCHPDYSSGGAGLELRQAVVEIANRLVDSLFVLDEGEPHEALTARPETRAW